MEIRALTKYALIWISGKVNSLKNIFLTYSFHCLTEKWDENSLKYQNRPALKKHVFAGPLSP